MAVLIQGKSKCCGCSACANICPQHCISMKRDSEGFEYPEIDRERCINCNLCEKVCPMLQTKMNKPVQLSLAAINTNEEVRMKSSSGGLFYAIAKYVLSLNGVVFGAAFEESNKKVVHIAVEYIEDLYKLQKSKYVQSEIGTAYAEVKRALDSGRCVLFSGTPCQVKGLHLYLGKDYDNLISVDIICHGVPSPKLWEKYIDYIEKSNHTTVSNVIFRYKLADWRTLGRHKIDKNTFVVRKLRYADPFIQMFLKNYSLRPSCYTCNVKENKSADITLGDFWGVEKICPEFNDGKGVSLVLIRSVKGKKLMEKIDKEIALKEVSYENAIQYNPSEYSSTKIPENRNEFFQDMNLLGFKKLAEKYLPLSVKSKVINICSYSKIYRYFKPIKSKISNYDWCVAIEQKKGR